MIAVGNDIVDLTAPQNIGVENNKRYISRIIADKELGLIPFITDQYIWLLWSIKETFYKVLAKQGHANQFYPKKIIVKSLNRIGENYYATVSWNDITINTVSHITYNYIHTTSHQPENVLTNKVFESNPEQVSHDLRQYLKNDLALDLQIPQQQIIIEKDRKNIPKISILNTSLMVDVSFSHDYNFGAYSYFIHQP